MQVRLLGVLEVELNGAAIPSSVSQRPWALFAYLALSPKPVTRADLAARFWPDVLDASARASLRSALWALRRELGDGVEIDRDRVGLRDAWIDVQEFDRLVDSREREQALELCRGELLEGLEDEWAILARERHRERVIDVLEELARGAGESEDSRAALEWTRRQAEQDPLDEAVQRRLIGRLAAAGERAAALRTYQSFAERLRRELGVAPSPSTRAVAEELRSEPAAAPEPRVRFEPLGPFVGRAGELRELLTAWQSSAAGAGAVALVRGEAGIGKTRLVSELRARAGAAGALTATCAALDLGGTAPLSLWAELVRELLPALPAPPPESGWPEDLSLLVGELPAHFARARGGTTDVLPDLQRTRLFEAIVALVDWAAREQPVLLVLEDIHTADGPSLELSGYVARRVAALPVMLVFTRRDLPRSGDADQIEQALRARGLIAADISLGPLSPDTMAELARKSERLSKAQVEQVIELAEGNALLGVETARALGRGVPDVAPSLRGSAHAALARLDRGPRSLTELAAVAGRPVEQAELSELSIDEVEEAAAAALDSGLLTAGDRRLGFRHALLREAVYAEIAQPRRPGLHRRWATAVIAAAAQTGVRRPAEAARHLRLAGRDRDAVEQLRLAAAEARTVAALEQAAEYLAEATAIEPNDPELWLELGEVEGRRARREEAEAAFERGLALLEESAPLTRARALLRRARVYHSTICVPRLVLENSRSAVELIDAASEPADAERREALAGWAWAEAVAGSVDEADRLLGELGSGRSEDVLEAYDIGHAQALAHIRRGGFAAAYAPSEAAGKAAEAAGRPDLAYGCWANAAGAAAAADDHAQALAFLDRALVVEGKGLQSLEVHVHAARSWVLTRLGRLSEASAASEKEREIAERLAQPELLAMAAHDRGLLAFEMGDYARSAELLAEALENPERISSPITRLTRAEALVHCDKLEDAAAELRATVLEPVRPSDFPDALVPRLARVQGLLARARGDHDEAERRLRESVTGWEHRVARTRGDETMTAVMADLGRPVVGIVEPARELARARADLEALVNAVVS